MVHFKGDALVCAEMQDSTVYASTTLAVVYLLQHLLLVTPVIGVLIDPENFDRLPNPGEVETIFDAPLEMFLKVSPFILARRYHLELRK
jgi:hypothetical protein